MTSDLEQVVDQSKRSNKALEMYECYIRSIIIRAKPYALETFTDMFPYNIHKPFGTSQCVY